MFFLLSVVILLLFIINMLFGLILYLIVNCLWCLSIWCLLCIGIKCLGFMSVNISFKFGLLLWFDVCVFVIGLWVMMFILFLNKRLMVLLIGFWLLGIGEEEKIIVLFLIVLICLCELLVIFDKVVKGLFWEFVINIYVFFKVYFFNFLGLIIVFFLGLI